MSDQPPEISEERLFFFEKQEIVVNDFDSAGYILDIGGGGEGVIGKLKGKQVIAIDPSKRELEEAAAGPLKIVMDARDLQFLDGSFSTATSFFTLMYIKAPDHEKVFNEVFRVLAPGGVFLIWDVIFPQRPDANKDVAVFLFLASFQIAKIATLHFLSGVQAQMNISSRFTPLEAAFWPFCTPIGAKSPEKCKAISGHFQAG